MRKTSTNEQGLEQLTLFQEAHPASPSPLPGSNAAQQMTVTSGRKCIELYGKYSQLGCFSKKLLDSSLWRSTRCFLTWKTQSTPAKHLLFRLAVSTPRTKDTAYVLWPTPSTGAALCGGTGNFKTLKYMQEAGIITEEERKELSKGNGGNANPEFLQWLMGYERLWTDTLLPTPIATDWKGGSSYRYWKPQGFVTTSSQNRNVERERERGTSGVRQPLAEPDRDNAVGTAGADQPGIFGVYERLSDRMDGYKQQAEHFWDNGEPEGLERIKRGVPHRKERIEAIGNAIPPQQFYPFYREIMEELQKEETA